MNKLSATHLDKSTRHTARTSKKQKHMRWARWLAIGGFLATLCISAIGCTKIESTKTDTTSSDTSSYNEDSNDSDLFDSTPKEVSTNKDISKPKDGVFTDTEADKSESGSDVEEEADIGISKDCKSVIANGAPSENYNFVFAFYGLTQNEIDQKGYDLVRVNFYRSEYKDKIEDPDFGFVPYNPDFFQTRAGLFEIEPFKSNIQRFNVYYLSRPISDGISPYFEVSQECTFMQDSQYELIILRRASVSSPSFNTWTLENVGAAFSHEIGHSFGLYDEYYTTMKMNDLSPDEITYWNEVVQNCDYGRPLSEIEYATGLGYCTKWCAGVDPTKYEIYKNIRALYEDCANQLANKGEITAWLDFCQTSLDFSRFFSFYGWYPGIVIAGTPLTSASVVDACTLIYGDLQTNSFYQHNIQAFCYSGTFFNYWDLNIGSGCMAGTGCYAGCGGFEGPYPSGLVGAFADSFRPHPSSLMGGGAFNNSGPDFVTKLHNGDSELPSYGDYGIFLLQQTFQKLGLR